MTTYPGVYLQEVPSGVRTITGVATSIAAFVDFFRRGPLNRAVQIFSIGDFEREFGGLDELSEASYGIHQFFLNGGSEAFVVRTASGDFAPAAIEILTDTSGGAGALAVEAISPGTWGNQLRVIVDYPEPDSEDRFNLTISLVGSQNGNPTVVRSESYLDLSMDTTDTRFVESIINDARTGSKLVRLTATPGDRPQATGSLSGPIDPFPVLTAGQPSMDVTISSEATPGSDETATARFTAVPTNLSQAREMLQAAIRAARPADRAFSQASVTVVDTQLRIIAGPTDPAARVTFGSGSDETASDLGLSSGVTMIGVLSGNIGGPFPIAGGSLTVTIGAVEHTITLGEMADLASARDQLEFQIRQADSSLSFTQARVAAYADTGEESLIVLADIPADAAAVVEFSDEGATTTASALGLAPGSAITALVSDNLPAGISISSGAVVNVTFGAAETLPVEIGSDADTLPGIAEAFQTAIRDADADDIETFQQSRVAAYETGSGNQLLVLAGTNGDAVIIETAPADETTVLELALTTGEANVQSYVFGIEEALDGTAQGAGTTGSDGAPPDGLALIGDPDAKTGIFALEDVPLFNILCLPRTAMVSGENALSDAEAAAVITAATNYCAERRAFHIMDTPNNIHGIQQIKEWLEANATLRHPNAALFFSQIRIANALNEFKLRSTGASGTMAGVFARTDSNRGVWKAPAGIEASLSNVQQLDYTPSDPENGTLNPLGINCLRNFPVYGNVCWGARTLFGANQQGSEWKYIPIRRLALFIEESLFRGTQWVVFEPNDEPLWAQIRLNIGAFMQNLFRKGAFQGKTSREAYLVKCDKETNPQNDIDQGIVNIIVGFAPLKPAEFVMIKIQQLAGQIQT